MKKYQTELMRKVVKRFWLGTVTQSSWRDGGQCLKRRSAPG